MSEATVNAVFDVVRGLNVASKISAIYFRDFASAADNAAFHFFRHRFAQFANRDAPVPSENLIRKFCSGK